ncbi:MAG: hypothetical protein U0176_07775 [Bacteroidia bacterium]
MPIHDKALHQALEAACPDNLATHAGATALATLRNDVIAFLERQYQVGPDLIVPPVWKDENESSTRFDAGNRVLTVFRNGFWSDTGQMMSGLLEALEGKFARPGTEIKKQRFEIRIRRLSGTRTLTLFIRPFLEPSPGAYDPQSGEVAGSFLQVHDTVTGQSRPSNPLLHFRQMSSLGAYRDTLKLLKAWQFHEGYPLECLALELLVLSAVADPAANAAATFTQRMKHVLHHSILLLEGDAALMDPSTDEPWHDFLSPAAKQRLADRWKLILQALQGTDPKQVLAFFPK